MKKILALLLSLALFVGMIPASYPVSAEDAVTPATGTVSVKNTEYFTFNRYSLSGDLASSGDLGDMRWDFPSMYDVPTGIYTASNGTYRWPYIAFKVNAETDDNYSISAYIEPSGSNTSSNVSMIVDGIVHKASLASLTGKQTATGNVYLSKGEHIVIFTVPMAEYKSQSVKSSSAVYPWCNYFNFTLSDGLSMVAAPTTAEINASVQGRRVQAGDTTLVNYNGTYNSTGTRAGGVKNNTIQQTYTDLENGYFDKTKIPYIEYTVEAPADGKYNIRIGSKVGGSDGENLPFAVVLVNDNIYKAQYDAKFDTSSGSGFAFDHVNLTVDMKKGLNLIKVTSLTKDQTAYGKDWIDHDYIDLPTTLTAVAPNASATISADDISSKVLANNYKIDANGAVGSAAQGDIRYDKISIEDARLKAPARLKKWPFVALKVTAAKDGYYEFTIGATLNGSTTSENLAMFVDGDLQAVKFKKGSSANIDASLYLSKGTHIVAITSPIPATNAEAAASTDDKTAYPWFNFNTFALSSGLTVENAPTLAEVTATVSTTIQAEDVKHHIYDATENGGSGTVVGGVSKSEITHTYDEVASFIDKAATGTPYVEYIVEAPSDGDYAISVGFVVGTSGNTSALTKPFAAVLVNDTAYKAQFDGSWGKLDESELVVTLKKGINLIKVTSLTTDQNAFTATTWINQDYIIVDSALTVLDNAGDTVTASASNRNHMAYNGYTVGTDDKGEAILGSSNNGDMRYYNMSLESLNIHDGSKIIPYAFMKVNAPKDGYYDMTLKVGVATDVTSKQIGMILDGKMNIVKFATKSNFRSFIDVSVYLTEGDHEIYFTTPMPETDADALALTADLDTEAEDYENTVNSIKLKAYPWMNVYYAELNGLEFLDAGANLGIAGDLDNNISLNAIDLSLLIKFLLGITVDDIFVENADIHRDGNINILDLIALKKAIVNGSSVHFSVGEAPLAVLSNFDVKLTGLSGSAVKSYSVTELDRSEGNVIEIGAEKQAINGFGASFTETSAYVMSNMPEHTLNDTMTKLFDKKNGIGISMLRNTIGASDFSLEYSTYDDIESGSTDYELEEFDMSSAAEQMALTKKAMELNSDIKLFLSPWSAPLWMKKYNTWGSYNNYGVQNPLKTECYDVYAKYLTKAVEGYINEGMDVYAITPQNEPFTKQTYPSMFWNKSGDTLAKFVNENLRPTLTAAGLETKILNLDYNYNEDNIKRAHNIMDKTLDTADGIGYHWYSGEPENMAATREKYPDKLIYVTEASSGNSSGIKLMLNLTQKMGRSIRSGANGYITWNIALDTEGGPTYNNLNNHCTALVNYDADTDDVIYGGDYYALGHFSKFLKSGAVMLESTDTGADSEYALVNTVFQNADGSKVAVVTNTTGLNSVFKFVDGGIVREITVPARGIITLVW